MKKHFALFLFLALCTPLFVMGQNWIWAKSAATTGNSNANHSYSVATDPSGNVIIAGSFQNAHIIFGSTNLTNSDPSGFTTDLFVAKYDSAGNALWAKRAGATNESDVGYSVATDNAGNVFVTGEFTSPTITFGPYVLNCSGGEDFFIVKYGPNGNVHWAKCAGGMNHDVGWSVDADPYGNVFAAGYFSDTISFGSTTLISNGGFDNFLVKYDSSGNVLWARSSGGANPDWVHSISTDQNGNVFIAGEFESPTITFGSVVLSNSDPVNHTRDIFIAKYDSVGNVLWAKTTDGAIKDDAAWAVSADSIGNAFITGYFGSPSISFGVTTLTNNPNSMNGTDDVFIAKYDSAGNALWAKSGTGIGGDAGFSVRTDKNGNAFITGQFQSDSLTFGNILLIKPNSAGIPVFLVKYDSIGNLLCADALASGAGNFNGVTTDLYGNAYLTGGFKVNPFNIGLTTLTLTSQEDVFLAKYRCDNPAAVTEIKNASPSFTLSPNPTSGVFAITTNLKTNFSVQIFNALGQQLSNTPGTQHSAPGTLDLSDQPDGIYFVRIISDGKIFAQKVVVQK